MNEGPGGDRGAEDPSGPDLFVGGGEMGALMRATDWSTTKLGPVETWPQSLRTMLGVVLGSRFPMLLWWGPDLLHLYNDAYRPILRDKHPRSLAAPAAEIWAEVWDVAGPMARSVQEGGPATWTEDLQLFIKSGAIAEETYFTFSYSPVPGDDGRIGGLLNTVQETTAKVQGEREIRMLHDLAARAADARSEHEAYRVAAEVLSTNELDLPFVLLYALGEQATEALLVAEAGWKEYAGRAKPSRVPIESENDSPWPIAEAIRTGRDLIVDDLPTRFGELPAGRWHARPERAMVMPLCRAAHARPYALLIAGLSPHRLFDDRYRAFFRSTAAQVANVIASARAYEAETKKAEALAAIDRAKTTFFSNVSHEFRTPLTLILGPVEEALAESGQSLQGDALKAVHRNGLRLLRLVNSLLDFARIESGRLELSFVPTDISVLTTDLASSFRSLFERAKLRLAIDCPPLAQPVYLDVAHWEKIVLNLVSNAFKFTFQGEIAVSVRAHDGKAVLTVRDSGTGIPARELERIFERFHRVDGAKGRSFEGTGIGLSLVRELVKLHGGSVRVSSVEGEGSTFEVSIPLGHAHLPADRIAGSVEVMPTGPTPYLLEARQWLEPGEQAGEVSAAPIDEVASPRDAAEVTRKQRARVLVVDDNADMRAYLARLLSSRWHVELATEGRTALLRAHSDPPDLILSDVMMPGMDGVTLLRELRAHARTAQIPVVLLSARTGEEAVLEGLERGADDYLAKPFAARELIARVQTHLELARVRREWAKELERAYAELEAFSYSVSHDLRAPLRAIDGFSKMLEESVAQDLGEDGRHYLVRIRAAAKRMELLIEALLSLAVVTRASLDRERVDLANMAKNILRELKLREPRRTVEAGISDDLAVHADPRLLSVMLENLIGNAWKFTSKEPAARIEVGKERRADETVFFVRDNGAGFDMAYASKLFAPFQRLHTATEFEGTGIGLATVQRVVTRHGGHIWAEASPNKGATFFFTLGDSP